MKKKEKPTQTQKQKEFSSSPFKALKGIGVGGAGEKAAPKPAPAPKEPVPTARDLSDESLFLEAMADVRTLKPRGAAPERAKTQVPRRSERDEEEERVFLQAVEALKIEVRFSDELPEQESPPRPVAVNRLRQVRRGGIRIDLQLDLHGLTRDEALENLGRFVKGAYNRGQKGVLIITGKGNNSPGEPVLKAAVSGWLREAGKGMVSEFVPAPREMGGSGAIVVFLKEKKSEEETKP
jgi:DNA-nicking Smr family endonuclease